MGGEEAQYEHHLGEIAHQETPGLGAGGTVEQEDEQCPEEKPLPATDFPQGGGHGQDEE